MIDLGFVPFGDYLRRPREDALARHIGTAAVDTARLYIAATKNLQAMKNCDVFWSRSVSILRYRSCRTKHFSGTGEHFTSDLILKSTYDSIVKIAQEKEQTRR
jgi:hypothetical protein